MAVSYYQCGHCSNRQTRHGACWRCGCPITYAMVDMPRIWACAGCGRPIWDAELCEVCDTSQCPVCFTRQEGQKFGLGCQSCAFQPYGTMDQARQARLPGTGRLPDNPLDPPQLD